MSSVLLTIETPDGPLDLSVPAHTTIEDLLDIVTQGGFEGWTLREPRGRPLDPTLTLEAAGVLDGVRLRLVAADADHAEEPQRRVTHPALRVIPDRTCSPAGSSKSKGIGGNTTFD